MSMQEIRQKSDAQLRTALREMTARLRTVRFGISMQQERNIAQHAKIRRTIARIKTELSARAHKQQ